MDRVCAKGRCCLLFLPDDNGKAGTFVTNVIRRDPMKRIGILVCILMLLTGCSGKASQMDRAMELRRRLLSQPASFDAEITADYGDKTYTFQMQCSVDTQGNLTFAVVEPEVISGITGTVSSGVGKLTFDDTALAFDLMADGQISPVSGPWVLLRGLRSGYLSSSTQEGELYRIAVDDSYEDDALHLEVWLDASNAPVAAEVYWQGRRLLTIAVRNFTFL